MCHDPECCVDANCPFVTELSCSVCSEQLVCSRPECCVDEDCEVSTAALQHCSTAALQQVHCTHCDQAGYVCEAELCVEEGECDAERPCEAADAVCELPSYANCEYCDLEAKECKPGCEEDSNCPGDYYCTDHYCVTQE